MPATATKRRAKVQPKAPVIQMPLTEGNAAWYRCRVERAEYLASLPAVERQYGYLTSVDEIPEEHQVEIAGLLMDAVDAAEAREVAEKDLSEAQQRIEDMERALQFVLEDANTELDYEARLIIRAALGMPD